MPDRPDKPYRIYHSGDAGAPEPLPQRADAPVGAGRDEPWGASTGRSGDSRPPSERRRDRRRKRRRRPVRLLLALLLGVIVVAVLGTAGVSRLGPLAGKRAAAPSSTPATAAPATSAPAADSAPSPAETPTAAATKPAAAPSFSVTAGGDVIGGFGVAAVLASMGSALFDDVAPVFEKSDFGFVNLESPLTDGTDAQGWKDVVIKGSPALAPAMAASGINVVTMANNHAGDMGDSGLLDSIRACTESGIAVVGAGRDLDEAMAGTVLETEDGVTVAFLGFTDVLPAGYPATPSSPGVAPGRADVTAVTDAVRAAARKADFVVVGWHWNFEYQRAPSALELSEGHAVIDAGADVVFAHHPHLLEGVEAYKDGLIFYSLGNLVFSGFSGETAETLLVRAKISRRGIEAQLVPVVGGGSGVPALARGARADGILQRVRSFSAALDTDVRIVSGKGYVHLER